MLLLENVPELIGSSNVKHFAKWLDKLETLGYTSFYQILNAKDFGIPQNRRRVFCVSILGNYAYDFPLKLKLKYRLKDFLEKEVDEKYYLDQQDLERIQNWNAYEKPLEKVVDIEHESIAIKENTSKGFKIAECGDGVNLASRMKHQRGNVQKGSIQTLKAQMEIGVVVDETNKDKSD